MTLRSQVAFGCLLFLASMASALAGLSASRALVRVTNVIYVDSSAQDDSGNGLTPLTPKKTFAAARAFVIVAGTPCRIALRRSRVWHEGLYGLPAGTTVLPYGTGDAPVIDSADPATSWSATAARTNVWETSWTRDTTYSNTSGFALVLLWDNDTQLGAVSSVALVESTAGSFYHDAVANKVYYHAADNGSPLTRQIYITKRPEGIYQYNAAGNSASGVTIIGIRARRSYAHYGGISNGLGGATKNCIVDGCGIHHMVLATGTIEDNVYFETSPTHTGGTIPLAVYQPNGVGANPLVTRLFVIGSLATRSLQGGVLTHTSADPTTAYNSVTYDQNYFSYGQGFTANSTGAYTVSNSLVENGTLGVALGTGTPTVTRSLFRNCIGSTATSAILSDAGPVDPVNRTRTITNNVIYNADAASTGGPTAAVRLTPRQGSITITNCVIYLNTPNRSPIGVWAQSNGAGNGLTVTINNCVILIPRGGAPAIRIEDADTTYLGDHNVFIRTDVAPSGTPFNWHGTTAEGLTTWRTNSGQDAHSVYLSASQFATFFSGTVANGDFRINPNNAVTDANGTIYTGQFPDGTALSTVGVQQHWNWNTRAIVSTAPTAWPIPPQTIAQANSYVLAPTAWNFY